MRKLLGVLAFVLLAACNPMAAMDDAGTGVETFHDRWNAGDSAAIWRDAHPDLRTGPTREQFDAAIAEFVQVLGTVESSEREGFNIRTDNGVTTTVITMRTQFTNGEAIEQFTFRDHEDELKLIYYYIESELLNTMEAPEGTDYYPAQEEVQAAE